MCAQNTIGPDEFRAKTSVYTPPAPRGTIRTQVNLVEVPIIVRDGSRAVAGLQRSDFLITDAGHSREIVSFSIETREAPAAAAAQSAVPSPKIDSVKSTSSTEHPGRHIALLFDDLNIDDADLVRVKKAAERFVKEGMEPPDRASVVTTAWPKAPVFTGDSAELINQIQALRSGRRSGDSESGIDCPAMNSYEAYLIANQLDTQLFNAKRQEFLGCSRGPTGRGPATNPDGPVNAKAHRLWAMARQNSENTLRAIRAFIDSMSSIPGRKMIVLTSSGFLSGELESELSDLMHRALHAGVVINSLESRGLFAYTPSVSRAPSQRAGAAARQSEQIEMLLESSRELALDDALASLAAGTGGRFYQNDNDLAVGYRNLAAVPDLLYVAGISIGDTLDGKFHPLKVKLLNGHKGTIQARQGYLAPLAAAATKPAAERDIDREFRDNRTRSDVAAVIEASRGPGEKKIMLTAHVDLKQLNMEQKDGRRIQHLTFIGGLIDSSGTFLSGKQGQIDFALKESSYAEIAERGFNVSLVFEAAPGKYIVRGILQEAAGKMTSSNQPIEIQ
jgi:VWFA-related protein